MPYASDKQRKFAHTDTAKKKGFPTEEFDAAERGKKFEKGKGKPKGKKRPVKFGKPY